MLTHLLRIGIVLAAAGVAFLLLVYGPLQDLERAQESQANLQQQYLERLKLRANLPLLRAQLPVMKDLDKAAQTILPNFDGIGAGPRDIEEAIRAIAREKKLASQLEFSTTDWSSKEFYYFRPFSVRVSGEFRQIVEFLQAVAAGSLELRAVKTATLQPVAGRDEVTLSLEGLVYRYREDEAAAAERKAKTRETGSPQ
jgi:Tfp pilus assembly protein PilO